ncbi:MAG: (Fe-S)-binding protein [Gammaproteobacteria bacterium]|nr:MAG: (Fe-S)-binding protein [Gammaproteobacteria bacterium]
MAPFGRACGRPPPTPPTPPSTPMPETDSLLEGARRCVHCGLCLPRCPTYALAREEGEAPRGRTLLIQGLLEGRLEPDRALAGHLERCLLCRACEAVCPAEVPFGRLMDGARAELRRRGLPLSPRQRELLDLAEDPRRQRRLAWLLWAARASGLAALAPLAGKGREARMLPRLPRPRPFRPLYPAQGEERGRVALFLGCLGPALDPGPLRAALALLPRLGYAVAVPGDQACCGALAAHAGEAARAARLAQTNRRAFEGLGVEAVLAAASGCAAQLAEGGKLGVPVRELAGFLAERLGERVGEQENTRLRLRPLRARAAFHTPCTLAFPLRGAEGPRRLLEAVPELEVVPLEGPRGCCGAAGAHLLERPEQADELGRPLIEALRRSGASLLLTSNTGCALHLRQLARRAGLRVAVLHPVELLARQMEPAWA